MPIDSGNLALKGLDDLFSTEENRQEEQREQVQQIPIGELHPFTNHPFKVVDDEAMTRTVESIAQFGVLAPLIARPRPDGDGYEIISGHRRKRAAALLGYRKIPVLIQPMSYEDAVVKMVDTNLHREHISFSEKAFAYRMKNEAMKQKVGRKKGQSGQQKKGKKTIELIGEEFGDSPKQIQRYIAVPEDKEEMALTLNGKKRRLKKRDFMSFASKCGIAENAAEKMLSKMCSLEDKLLCACEDSYLPEKYIEQTKQLITTRIAVLKEG